MKLLVIGSGGREHTLAWKLAQSSRVSEIFIAPGNAGTASLGTNVDLDVSDHDAVRNFIKEKSIDLTVIGPEQPLVDGLVDALQSEGLPVFGPRQSAARLEGSKAFSKEFMQKYHIPCAASKTFTEHAAAKQYVEEHAEPLVVKASGLAAGKGAIVCQTRQDALNALERIMVDREFGEAGDQVLVEECLIGEELSVIALADGKTYHLLSPSQDHKPAYDNDEGPNTGGMGAYAPAPAATPELLETVVSTIIEPTLEGMKAEDAPYVGFLYCGLILTKDGPKVLEYNCRLGDPETQVILPLIESDFLELLDAAVAGQLSETPFKLSAQYATCVVAASGGYPMAYEKHKKITGLDAVNEKFTMVFHAGTQKSNSDYHTSGGRVLGVTCLGPTLSESIDRAYAELKKINFDGMHYRTDIGKKGLRRL